MGNDSAIHFCVLRHTLVQRGRRIGPCTLAGLDTPGAIVTSSVVETKKPAGTHQAAR